METAEQAKKRIYDANKQSLMGNLDWAYSNVLKGSPISENVVWQNMGLSSVQGLDKTDKDLMTQEIMSAYNQKYGSAGTPARPSGGQFDYGGAAGLNAALAGNPAAGKASQANVGASIAGGNTASQGPLTTTPSIASEVAARAGETKNLIDIANSRPDVLNTAKAQGGDPFTAGTGANTWLNNWFNSAGKNEYPGTTLTQPSNAPQTGNQGVNTGAGGTSYDANDPRAVLADMLTKMMKQQEDLMNFYKNQPTAMDNYQKYSDQLGYGTQQKQQVGLASQINKTEQVLNDLEKNITSRITELGEGMSEAQRARQYATEKKEPMEKYTELVNAYKQGEVSLSSARTQLADLMKYAESDQTKAATLAGMPLDYSQKMLPTLISAAEYQSPQEKLADKIAEEKAMQAIKPDITYSIQDVGGRTVRFGFDANGNKVSSVDLGSSTKPGSGDEQSKRDAAFETFAKDLANQVNKKEITREQATAQLRTLYSDYDENVIYDLVPNKK